MGKFPWFQNKRGYARLDREISSLKIHMEKGFDAAEHETPWFQEASAQIGRANDFLERHDAEGGWFCFHAAQRLLVNGMTQKELACEAIALKAESDKLSSWRRDAVKALLELHSDVTPRRLIQAIKLRDEYDANQYHKIWITSDQLRLLCVIGGLATLTEFVSLFLSKGNDSWSIAMLAAVAAFGVSGSAFSVGQTVIGMASSSKIPEHVANHWATLMRTFFGSITGLAGYVFYSSQVIRIQVGDGQNKMATAMTIAFVFGYAGEKLISKIVDSIGSSGTRNAK